MRQLLPFFIAPFFFLLIGCDDSSVARGTEAKRGGPAATKTPLARLAERRIFFAHQSVGYNIIDGLRAISERAGIKINIAETGNPADFRTPVFAHHRVGANTDPYSKLSDFEARLDSGIGSSAEVAILKFCYVDVTSKTDVRKLFDEYAKTMSRLKQRYPHLALLHATIPLTTVDKGLKAKLRALLGKDNGSAVEDNIKRNQYNALLRARYQGKEPIYDLAHAEAEEPNGTVGTFSSGDVSYESLFPPYSSDGGHLSGIGKKKAAEALALAVTSIP